MAAPAALLADIPLFALLDEDERATLAERLDVVSFGKGTNIFRLGEPGDALFVVKSGEVELSFTNDLGDRIVIEVARAGDFFGELSLLDGGPRTAHATATEDVEAILVDRGDLDDFLRRHPPAALDLLAATGRRLRESTRRLRHPASRDVNEEEQDRRTPVMKVADAISEFSGSVPFLLIHCVVFFVWIVDNAGPLAMTHLGGWDPYPFGLLTMVVSLEAIILSVFVLLSQNRQVARDRVRNDIEYRVNLQAELEVAALHGKLEDLESNVLARLTHIEKHVAGRRPMDVADPS